MTVYPYNITHLPLEDDQEFNLPWSRTEGQYIVLWWRCIAIGELYIRAGVELNDEILRGKIIVAIEPAVDMYMAGKPPKASNANSLTWIQWSTGVIGTVTASAAMLRRTQKYSTKNPAIPSVVPTILVTQSVRRRRKSDCTHVLATGLADLDFIATPVG